MQIKLKNKLLSLSNPLIMGILNCTPDSFFDGNQYNTPLQAIKQAEKMLMEGASIIDIGGFSTKPGGNYVSEEEEISRVLPVIKAIKKYFPEAIISIDTFRSNIAKATSDEGIDMINDISGGQFDKNIFQVIAQNKLSYCLMHLQGTLNNMHQPYNYNNITLEVNKYFSEKISQLHALGIHDICIDPGFGFSKNSNQNYTLLHQLNSLHLHNKPILVGLSRKSMIYKKLNTTPENALNGTTILHTLSVLKGAHIIRTHDVKETNDIVKLLKK